MRLFDLETLEALPFPLDKSELLARIPAARRPLEDLVASVGDAQWTVGSDDGWTVRDHLSHIAAWERMVVAHLTSGNDHDVVSVSATAYAELSLDEINAHLYELHRSDATSAVAAEFASAHRAIMQLIERLSDDDMARPYWDDDARPVIEKLTGDTYRHYLEHRRWICELMASGVRP